MLEYFLVLINILATESFHWNTSFSFKTVVFDILAKEFAETFRYVMTFNRIFW